MEVKEGCYRSEGGIHEEIKDRWRCRVNCVKFI